MNYVIMGMAAIIILLLLVMIWSTKEKTEYKKTLNSVINHLDQAITGTEQNVIYDESIEAAITEKLNQLVVISRMNYEEASKDRGLVQALISDIAHQVRTPLTNIMLYAGILQEKALSEEKKKWQFRYIINQKN